MQYRDMCIHFMRTSFARSYQPTVSKEYHRKTAHYQFSKIQKNVSLIYDDLINSTK